MTENRFLENTNKHKKEHRKTQNLYRFVFLSVFICVFTPSGVGAAVLYLEPASGKYYQDDIFIVEVKLDTEGETINTAGVDLTFSQDVLEVKDFSRGNSILTLFAKAPVFSNQKGKISFVGGIPGGFQGNGLLGRIVFRAKEINKEPASVEVEFLESSQVLLNDGLGTPAELTTKGAVFTILPEKLEFPKDEWQEILKEDNILPEPFEIIIAQDPFIFEGKYFIVFFTQDKQTGIDYYEVAEVKPGAKLRETERETTLKWKRGESPYLLEDQSLKSIILVRAVDKAGNERIAEYVPPRETFSYWIIVLILLGIGIIWWIIKSRNRRKTLRKTDAKHYEQNYQQ